MAETKHSYFTMTPNIAYELLTNELDLVGYQKLLKTVGMGGKWTKGSRALAKILGMSLGRITAFKNVLESHGFVKVIPGEKGRGIADEWQVIDIWNLNKEYFTCSPNDTGQDEIVADFEPTCSPNETKTCSPNDTVEEKIFTEDLTQENFNQEFVITHSSSSAEDGERRESVNRSDLKLPKEAKSRKPNPPSDGESKKIPQKIFRNGFSAMAWVCFRKKTAAEMKNLHERERGQLNQNLKKLYRSGYDLSKIRLVDEYHRTTWRAAQEKGSLELLRPDQVVTFFRTAMEWAWQFGKLTEAEYFASVGEEFTEKETTETIEQFSDEPFEAEPLGENREIILGNFRQLVGNVGFEAIEIYKENYTAEDWAWLKENLEKEAKL